MKLTVKIVIKSNKKIKIKLNGLIFFSLEIEYLIFELSFINNFTINKKIKIANSAIQIVLFLERNWLISARKYNV
jgi:hypothetical protein